MRGEPFDDAAQAASSAIHLDGGGFGCSGVGVKGRVFHSHLEPVVELTEHCLLLARLELAQCSQRRHSGEGGGGGGGGSSSAGGGSGSGAAEPVLLSPRLAAAAAVFHPPLECDGAHGARRCRGAHEVMGRLLEEAGSQGDCLRAKA